MVAHVGPRMLWGGDAVPVFNVPQLLRDVLTQSLPWRTLGVVYMPQLSVVLISGGLRTFFESLLPFVSKPMRLAIAWHASSTLLFLASLAFIYYASSSLFEQSERRKQLAAFTVAALFFAFNPWSTIDTFKSYLGATSLQSSLFVALIGFFMRAARALAGGPRLGRLDVLVALAASSMLYMQSPSSAARGIAEIGLLATALAAITLPLLIRGKRMERIFIYVSTVAAATVPALVAAAFIPLLGYTRPLTARVESVWGGATPPEKFLWPSYATPLTAIEGMNTWIAFSEYMPYGSLYHAGLLAALMMLWPLASVAAALLLASRSQKPGEKATVYFLSTLYVIAVAWGAALNGLFISLKALIVEAFPVIVKVLYWGITIKYVRVAYILLAAYVAAMLVSRGMRNLAIVITIMLLATSLPIFTGNVFGQYYNETIKGVLLSDDYFVLRELPVEFYEHILVTPATGVYMQTQWGYMGSSGWYRSLNTATLVEPLAPYIQYTSWSHLYKLLSTPCITAQTVFDKGRTLRVGGVYINKSLVTLSPDGAATKSLVVTVRGVGRITVELGGNLVLKPGDTVGFIVSRLGSRVNTSDTAISAELVIRGTSGFSESIRALMPKDMDTMWRVIVVNDTTALERVTLWLKSIGGPEEVLVTLTAGPPQRICSEWISLSQSLAIRYVVLDRSIVSKQYTAAYYATLERLLNKTLQPIYRGKWLTIYHTGWPTKPASLYTSSCSPSSLEVISAKPANVTLQVEERCRPMVVFPLLNVVYDTRVFETRGMESSVCNALLCGSLEDSVASLVYTRRFSLVYTAYALYMLVPLLLLTVLALYTIRRGGSPTPGKPGAGA